MYAINEARCLKSKNSVNATASLHTVLLPRHRSSHMGAGAAWLPLLLSPFSSAASPGLQHPKCPGEWIDVDTPPGACTAKRERDGGEVVLVFSDEFERRGRTYIDGHDTRWTGLDSAPYSNEQVNYYNASNVITMNSTVRSPQGRSCA